MNYKDLKKKDFPEGEPVLKWKRGLWYRANNCGYTDRVTEAGLYEREEALRYCFTGEKNGSCEVLAVPVRVALDGYTTADLKDKLKTLQTLIEYVPESDKKGMVIF